MMILKEQMTLDQLKVFAHSFGEDTYGDITAESGWGISFAFQVADALYKYLSDYNEGQDSETYSALSRMGSVFEYRPGMGGPAMEETAQDLYVFFEQSPLNWKQGWEWLESFLDLNQEPVSESTFLEDHSGGVLSRRGNDLMKTFEQSAKALYAYWTSAQEDEVKAFEEYYPEGFDDFEEMVEKICDWTKETENMLAGASNESIEVTVVEKLKQEKRMKKNIKKEALASDIYRWVAYEVDGDADMGYIIVGEDPTTNDVRFGQDITIEDLEFILKNDGLIDASADIDTENVEEDSNEVIAVSDFSDGRPLGKLVPQFFSRSQYDAEYYDESKKLSKKKIK